VEEKRISLEEAAEKIHDGAHLFWGGFGYQRPPAEFARELIRQRKRGLTLYTCGSEIDIDMLAGARVAKRFELAFFAIEAIGLAPNGVRRVRGGELEIEDYTNLAMSMRLYGGAMGVPFMPVKSMLGTDLEKRSRFRKDKLKAVDCPFTGERVILVPSVRPDFSIVHVQRVDPEGNAQIDGIKGEDEEGARAGKKLIVIAEEIISNEIIRTQPDLTVIPGIYVDYVVEAPWGSHPMSVYKYYDYDLEHIKSYVMQCQTEEGWEKYCDRYILSVDRKGYLKEIGEERLLKLKAKPEYGY